MEPVCPKARVRACLGGLTLIWDLRPIINKIAPLHSFTITMSLLGVRFIKERFRNKIHVQLRRTARIYTRA